MKLLETINDPADLRKLPRTQLTPLANELRQFLLDIVSQTGGHLSSNLGTVELTIALHYVFDTPARPASSGTSATRPIRTRSSPAAATACRTLRQLGGLSGFPQRDESEYDTFGTAHSSTSISAALGMAHRGQAEGREPQGHRRDRRRRDDRRHGLRGAEQRRRVRRRDLLVILNDNDMSISPPVGALNRYLARLMCGPVLRGRARTSARRVLRRAAAARARAQRFEEHAKGMVVPGHDVRGIRLQLHRPDRRPRPRLADPDAGKHQAS